MTFFFQEYLRFLATFLVCAYFCDRAAGLLPKKDHWKRYLTAILIYCRLIIIVFILNTLWMVVFTIIILFDADLSNINFCKKPYFLTERMGGLIVSIFFFIMGLSIDRSIRNMVRVTEYDHKIFNT